MKNNSYKIYWTWFPFPYLFTGPVFPSSLSYSIVYGLILWWHFLNWSFLLSYDVTLGQGDIKLVRTLAIWSYCLDFSTMLDWNLEFWPTVIPSLYCLFQGIFIIATQMKLNNPKLSFEFYTVICVFLSYITNVSYTSCIFKTMISHFPQKCVILAK